MDLGWDQGRESYAYVHGVEYLFSPLWIYFSLFSAFNYTTRCAEDWKTMGAALMVKPVDEHSRIDLAGGTEGGTHLLF